MSGLSFGYSGLVSSDTEFPATIPNGRLSELPYARSAAIPLTSINGRA